MARNDKILQKADSKDIEQFELLITKALQARRKIETGFIELAESIFDIHRKKLYKIKYKTFNEFCEEELGFSRGTVYIYIAILKLISLYPSYFPKKKAIEFGHKKMRFITEGINAVDLKNLNENKKEKIKIEILEHVKPEMPSTEIEAYIDDVTESL